jgi:hypothetical protein
MDSPRHVAAAPPTRQAQGLVRRGFVAAATRAGVFLATRHARGTLQTALVARARHPPRSGTRRAIDSAGRPSSPSTMLRDSARYRQRQSPDLNTWRAAYGATRRSPRPGTSTRALWCSVPILHQHLHVIKEIACWGRPVHDWPSRPNPVARPQHAGWSTKSARHAIEESTRTSSGQLLSKFQEENDRLPSMQRIKFHLITFSNLCSLHTLLYPCVQLADTPVQHAMATRKESDINSLATDMGNCAPTPRSSTSRMAPWHIEALHSSRSGTRRAPDSAARRSPELATCHARGLGAL